MGNTWTQDTAGTWNQDDVKKWQESSRELQKQYYNGYEGAEFHEIDCGAPGNLQLLTAKICFALFGMPTVEKAETLLDGYTADQQKDAGAFVDSICELYTDGRRATIGIMALFICCKSNEYEYTLPVFRLSLGEKTIKYMDTSKRVYTNWQDFLDNNKFPMMKYCYPKHGFYSCSDERDSVKYDENEYPSLGYGTSPACDLTGRIATTLDVSSMITSFGSAGIMIVGMFTPLAPVIMITGGVAGVSSAVWGTSRSVQRLVDKGQHGESLTDLESMTSWLAIALTPLSVATSAVNAQLANGARVSGRIFSSTVRTAATILNCTTLGLQSGMLALGLANLVQKAQKKQLSALDVIQFSMTVFFFTNTVMQPKTASGIIAKAQSEHIQQYRDTMNDETTKATFDKYLAQNKGDGGIRDTSKIVRSLNKIENPDQLFKGLSNAENIQIGGRKGNTLLVSQEGTKTMPTRIPVNRTFFTARPITTVQRDRMNTALDGHRKTPFGRKVLNLDNMEPHEAARLNSVLKATCRNYDARIIDAAVTVAQDLDVQNVGDFCAVLELVNHHGGSKAELEGNLASLMGSGRAEFIDAVRADMARARQIANNAGAVFGSDLKATYHFRKHGAEFVLRGDPMDYYLRVLPEKHFTTQNLRNVEIRGEIISETYCSANGDFGVLIKRSGSDRPIVATVFTNDRYIDRFNADLAAMVDSNNFQAPAPSYISELLSHLSGGADPTEFLRFFHIQN